MYANTCWGFLGLAVTFGLAVLGLPADYGWLQPWLFGAAVISGVTSVICFLWPLIYRAARTLRKQISGPQHLLTSPSLILPDEAFGLGQWIYFESRSIRAPDGGETKLYETKFYIVVSNTLESGHTLKNVQVEISGYGVPVFAPILGAAGSAIDLKHGRTAYIQIGLAVGSDYLGHFVGNIGYDADKVRHYEHNIFAASSKPTFEVWSFDSVHAWSLGHPPHPPSGWKLPVLISAEDKKSKQMVLNVNFASRTPVGYDNNVEVGIEKRKNKTV